MSCKVCEVAVDANTLVCSGPCGNSYHISCIPAKDGLYKNVLVTYVKSIPNLRWFCDECLPLTLTAPEISMELETRLVQIKTFADALLTKLASSASTKQIDISTQTPIENGAGIEIAPNLNGSSSSSMSVEFTDDATKLPPPESSSPSPTDHPNVTTRGNKRPPPPSSPTTSSQNAKRVAESQTVLADLIAKPQIKTIADLVAKPKEKKTPQQNVTVKTNMVRSIYISPFDPSTKPSDIIGILEREEDLKHIVPNVKCKKLVGRGQWVSFASFKLDVRRDQFEIIMAAPVWKATGIENFKIMEFSPKKPDINANGPTENDGNPFTKPPGTPTVSFPPPQGRKDANQQSNRRPAQNHGANHRPPQRQSQNFCQKDCCNRQRPNRNRRSKGFGGNRFASQQHHRH